MRRSISELRDMTSAARAAVHGMIRRVAIGVTGGGLFQGLGFETAPGERETFDKVRAFQGVGFSARPRAGKGEAIIANVGAAAAHPVIIATSDPEIEPTDLEPDETQMHTSKTSVRITKDGDVVITLGAGRQVFMSDDGVALTPLLNGVVVGAGIDTFTGATYGALGNASAVVLAKK